MAVYTDHMTHTMDPAERLEAASIAYDRDDATPADRVEFLAAREAATPLDIERHRARRARAALAERQARRAALGLAPITFGSSADTEYDGREW